MRNRRVVSGAVLFVVTSAIGYLLVRWRQLVAPRQEQRVGGDGHRLAAPREEQVGADADDAQTAASGAGELVHRRYEVRLVDCSMDRLTLLRTIQRNLADLPPAALADFAKSSGDEHEMQVGDEYDIVMLGPWNGRVRVSEMESRSFTLVTLAGHPEAGHITFSVVDDLGESSGLCVRIESWARSRDKTVKFAYGTLGIGKQVQTEVWVTFLQRVSTLAGIVETPEVEIFTEIIDDVEATADASE